MTFKGDSLSPILRLPWLQTMPLGNALCLARHHHTSPCTVHHGSRIAAADAL